MDPALVVGVCLIAGGVVTVATAPLAVALIGAATVLRRSSVRLAPGLVALALLAGACGGVRSWRVIARHEAERLAAWEGLPAPSRCAAEGEVLSSPTATHGLLRWDARLTDVMCDGKPVRAGMTTQATLYGETRDVARGDRLRLTVQLATVERFWNAATSDPRPGDSRRGALWSGSIVDLERDSPGRGPAAWVDHARAYVRARIDATFPSDTSAMARALVLGESDLSDGDDADFRASGLAHLLAVSGMHLVIVVAGAVSGLRAVLVRVPALVARYDVARATAGLAIPLTWLYAQFAGAGGSTLRAAWMMTVALTATALGRRSTAPRAFGLSLVAMAATDPLVVFDLSFLLSAAATAGLIALSRPIAGVLSSHAGRLPSPLTRPLGWLAEATAPTLAATLPCAPILARFAPTQPLGGVLANLIAVPLGEAVALPVCLVHAMAAPLPRVEVGTAMVATGALRLVRFIAHAFAHFRPLLIPVPPPNGWQLVCVTLGLLALVSSKGRSRIELLLVFGVATVLCEVLSRRAGSPRGVLRATFLDVGQGDASLVDLPDGQAVLIDGGGIVGSPVDTGTRVIAPTLRDRRRTSLAAVVLSHPHPDHFTGLVSGLDAVTVGALWDTGQGEREGTRGGYAALLEGMRARGVPILRPDALCGAHEIGGAKVDVLAPCPGPSPDRGPNDNSLVVRVAYGARAFLFVGDSEHEAEGDLVRLGGPRLHADVLKVGHHGSRTSSSAGFVAAVAPSFAVISVGLRNRFGHPHPHTLEVFRAAGLPVFRTDRDGAVVAWTDGHDIEVHPEGR